MEITSTDNKLIKHIASLHKKKYRDEYNEYIIEGIKSVKEALQNNVEITHIIACNFNESLNTDLEIITVPNHIMEKISEAKTPQGLLAVAKITKAELPTNSKRILILDNLQDPGNLGTIIRTADATAFDAIIISKNSVDLYSPKVVRSTMGSLFHLPIITNADLEKEITNLKEKNFTIYMSLLDNDSKNLFEENLKTPLAIVIGNEGNGISKELIPYGDVKLKIPMPGKSESLNASIAASILMYETIR